ncbi:M23 family metallopeptidase [Domibacillus indicus]|uniref:M23 family metallopeptidase n=3 Tax=Domibacillus TaxID=1433999 RepID=UPI00203F730B|nr:M23 family metallopeptidase [Domibacillus indicus]MCM3788839.1 M23 family metallopeptidase [Domibacillus indicus]
MTMKEGGKKTLPPKLKDFFMKRRALPVIYLACAILLISSLMFYEVMKPEKKEDAAVFDQPAESVNGTVETEQMIMPVVEGAIAKTAFYDSKAKAAQQEEALVVFNDTYYESTGVDYALENGKTFAVSAPLSGTVTDVREDAFIGNYIEIDHGNGAVSTFQSIKDIQVKKDDKVSQGQKIGEAGRSILNESAGIHVHFEMTKDGDLINPSALYGKAVSEWK